jgi:L-lactate dehydrogenase complex protein LldG
VSSAREEVLARIRAALADVPAAERPQDVAVARDYRRAGMLRGEDLIELFEQRLGDYGADVRRVGAADVTQAVSDQCRGWGLVRVVVAPGAPRAWWPSGVETIRDIGLDAHALDAIDGAVTGCAVAIAETGTLVLDAGERSGRRIITLVPDHHICIVERDQVVELVPEAIAALAPAAVQRRAPITFVSGPSASSDIELSRVEGVHGPRNLLVLIVDDPASA